MSSTDLLSAIRGGERREDAANRTIEAIYATAHWLLGEDRPDEAARVLHVMLKFRPHDERGWLALGACHERLAQPRTALELYGTGTVAAAPSPRLLVARSRVLRTLGRDGDADAALDEAARAAELVGDEPLMQLIDAEMRRAS
jgi:hypothetical protein